MGGIYMRKYSTLFVYSYLKISSTDFIYHKQHTSHSAYVATETELYGAKIDGLLPPNFF